MSASTSTTQPPPVASTQPLDPRPRPRGLLHATAIIATIGVVVALVGFAMLLRPVSTQVQDCGTSLGFLLDGRSNVYVDPQDPPTGVTKGEAIENNENPCRERVAYQAKLAGVPLVTGLMVAIGAALVELTVRGVRWTRRRKAS